MARVDMHCHTCFSDRPTHWILHKMGGRESHISPDRCYELLKRRGMAFVTVTDHDTIDGALQLADGHDDVIVGCEFTVHFASEKAATHICVYDLDESEFREGVHLSGDIRQFAAYFRERGRIASVAHPFHGMMGQLKVGHIEQLVLLFDTFEEHNGLQVAESNAMLREFLDRLNPALIETWMHRHRLFPDFQEPWAKARLGGSDDHSSIYLGTSFTTVEGARSKEEFLEGIRRRQSRGTGLSTTSLGFAHTIHANAGETLMNRFTKEGASLAARAGKLLDTFGEYGTSDRAAPADPSPGEQLTDYVLDQWAQSGLVRGEVEGRDLQEETFGLLNGLFNASLRTLCEKLPEHLSAGDLGGALSGLAQLGPAAVISIPYIMGFEHIHSDDEHRRNIRDTFRLRAGGQGEPERWAWFSDTVNDINGVARTIQTMTALAKKKGTPITTFTCCRQRPLFTGDVRHFDPIHEFRMPEYESMPLVVPPLLEMLSVCEREGYTRFIISTPGPVGIAALWIAKLLRIPTAAIYHTDVPRYVGTLTGDQGMESLAWRLVRYLYGQVDQVYVLTEAYRCILMQNGLAHQDIRIFPKGTDVELFHPSKRDPSIWRELGVNGHKKILYVGRISREKNLDILIEAFASVRAFARDVELVIVGDGPYREALESRCQSLTGIRFTGFKEGDALARLVASADIFAFPSCTDTYGSAVLEAQASGLPAVVTDRGGPCEVIRDGVTGLVTRGEDVESFAAALLKLVQDSALRARMGVAARAHAEQKSWEKAFEEFRTGGAEQAKQVNNVRLCSAIAAWG